MATTPEEFQQLAADTKIEFRSFYTPAVFTKSGVYDPLTGETVGDIKFTVDGRREGYTAFQMDNQSIEAKDFQICVNADEFTSVPPDVDGLAVLFEGKDLTVITTKIDDANAVWTLQVRG